MTFHEAQELTRGWTIEALLSLGEEVAKTMGEEIFEDGYFKKRAEERKIYIACFTLGLKDFSVRTYRGYRDNRCLVANDDWQVYFYLC